MDISFPFPKFKSPYIALIAIILVALIWPGGIGQELVNWLKERDIELIKKEDMTKKTTEEIVDICPECDTPTSKDKKGPVLTARVLDEDENVVPFAKVSIFSGNKKKVLYQGIANNRGAFYYIFNDGKEIEFHVVVKKVGHELEEFLSKLEGNQIGNYKIRLKKKKKK